MELRYSDQYFSLPLLFESELPTEHWETHEVRPRSICDLLMTVPIIADKYLWENVTLVHQGGIFGPYIAI